MENKKTEAEELRVLLTEALRRVTLTTEYVDFILTDYELGAKEKEICREVKRLLTEID